jgi:hypothetical protein
MLIPYTRSLNTSMRLEAEKIGKQQNELVKILWCRHCPDFESPSLADDTMGKR